ncbi:protein-arginine deiminase type-1 [Alligator sinensis]|uniref:protein-arginine deiminase n=1 Tax=Alligator sinensis TaxID=38654 RepID=A0A1U7SN34_ALLSI|nr:protein-arginine deiminase type-1 [Alligator sinensis]
MPLNQSCRFADKTERHGSTAANCMHVYSPRLIMTKQRVLQVSPLHPRNAICVVGTEVFLDIRRSIPRGATSFDVHGTSGVRVYIIYNHDFVKEPMSETRWPLDANIEITITMDFPSETVNDNKVRISYYGENGNEPIETAWLYLTCVSVSLDTDTNRTGVVESSEAEKTKWTWGPDGHGAVLLVNCDRDSLGSGGTDNTHPRVQSYADLQDMSIMILRTQGPSALFAENKLVLQVPASEADKVRVFHAAGNDSYYQYKPVLGPDKLSYAVDHASRQEITFYVEGLAFPDQDFSGLVSFSVMLLEVSNEGFPDTPIFTDTVVFRVSPWIMTPNTLQPLEVFVCSIESGANPNVDFLSAMSALVRKANCKLTVCPQLENRSDRWIQDELEFGYVEAPHKLFPVVFDSPRNRGLQNFPLRRILGPDFGYVTREPPKSQVSGLDSFGNLDVSPPVTVQGKEYPLGRILIGSSFPRSGGRRMAKVIRDFLYAQAVQPPVEVYSDWLTVGHVDEFLTFVPASDRKGFRLLLGSPRACYQLFEEKQQQGHGDAAQFTGLAGMAIITIDEILANETLRRSNRYAQNCIDWNRKILKQELGLSEEDIIDIPQLFVLRNSFADAFFPNLVNLVVLGTHLGIPKPFGPIVDGQCCLEEKVRSLLEPLGLTCTFINDFFSYFELEGDVHCGTNVLRKPFSFQWWNMIP